MSTFRRYMLGGLLLLAACGSGTVEGGNGGDAGTPDGPQGLPGLESIEVMPRDITLMFEGDTPVSQTYTAIGHFMDGHQEDVTTRVGFTLDNFSLGSFDRNVFTSFTGNGGRGKVRAFSGTIEGFGFLTLKIKQRYADPQAGGLPPDPSAPFNGSPDAARNPDVVYPPDTVLLPPNLGSIEMHWLPGADNDLFELSFQSDTTDVIIYTSCVNPTNGGCIYMPEAKVWRWLAESNRGSQVGLVARGTKVDGSAGVGTATSMTMAFSQDYIDGGLYYWTTPKGQAGEDGNTARIYRWDFASTTQTVPEEVITPTDTGDYCVGCHALSPDGRKLFVTSDGSYNAYPLIRDLMTGDDLVPWNTMNNVAFASWEWPDGARFVGTFGDNEEPDGGFVSFDLNIFDGNDGSLLETIPVGGSDTNRSTHPDWSPDGTMIAFTRVGIPNDGVGTGNGNGTTVRGFRTIVRVVKQAGGVWGAPIDLTASTVARSDFYPAFSPDSSLVLFNRSTCTGGSDTVECDMYDDPGAGLWTILPQEGATAVPLALANAPGKTDAPRTFVQSSFAKWTPFTFRRTGELGDRLFWFTFSSDRNYGLRHPDSGEAQIWMAGYDPDAGARGEDGSYPAFFLPFQEATRDNHTAQWTRRVVHIP